MPRYSIIGEDTNTAATTQLYFVNSSNDPTRLKLYEVIIGSDTAPADNAATYHIRRVTNENGTPGGTAVTPFPLDFDDQAARSTAVEAPTGEPTIAAGAALEIGINQRATFRWVAAPGSELIADNAEDNGWCIFVQAVSTAASMNYTMLYEE